MMRVLSIGAAACAVAGLAMPAFAQDPTVEDLNNLFRKQIEAQEQPLTRSLGGDRGRGLTPVTIENVQAEPVAVDGGTRVTSVAPSQIPEPDTTGQTALPSAQTAPTVAAGTQLATPPVNDPNTPLVYAKLAPELQVNLQIKFEFDSAALSRAEENKLLVLCAAMKASDIRLFRIIGHTDTSGTAEYNERLSNLRAKEVARHLVQDCGIAAARLETVGLGERFPVNEADTRADENRRVEFQALS